MFYDGADHWLADGFHRVRAFESAKRTRIPVDLRQGSKRDAILHRVGANALHGLTATPASRAEPEARRMAYLARLATGGAR